MRPQARGAGLIAPTQSALPPFHLIRAESLRDVAEALAAHPDATIAAGCTDIVAAVREGLTPTTLLSVRQVPELTEAEHGDSGLVLGAGLTHDAGSALPVVRLAIPGLARAWAGIATVRVRFRATIGGNLMARRFRYEMPVILGALDARMLFTGPNGEHTSTVDEFVRSGSSETDRRLGLLHRITVDTRSLTYFDYDRSLRPVTTLALALRAPAVSGAGARVIAVVGSEYRRAVRLGVTLSSDTLEPADIAPAAAELAALLPDWSGDYTGSAEYRRHLVEVMVRRQLNSALGART
jgi:carbon-monoxide dehydrogenase medium subunit